MPTEEQIKENHRRTPFPPWLRPACVCTYAENRPSESRGKIPTPVSLTSIRMTKVLLESCSCFSWFSDWLCSLRCDSETRVAPESPEAVWTGVWTGGGEVEVGKTRRVVTVTFPPGRVNLHEFLRDGEKAG